MFVGVEKSRNEGIEVGMGSGSLRRRGLEIVIIACHQRARLKITLVIQSVKEYESEYAIGDTGLLFQ